jgi:hypothetical protein
MTIRCLLGCALALCVVQTARADTPRLDYRIVFANARHLEAQLESAGRDGFACIAVARPDPGVVSPGIAVVLGRIAGGKNAAVPHRVVTGGYSGSELQESLDRAGADRFHLCGVVMDETTGGRIVAVLRQDATTPPDTRYGVEVLTNYKASLGRLAAAGKDGFVPMAATPVNNNRVPESRSWMVITERRDAAAREIAVRSGSGPGALEKAFNEQGKLGYQVDLIWQEGADVVAMLSRPAGDAKTAHTFTAEARRPDQLHFLSGRYLGDFPYLSGGDRLVVSDTSQPASTDVEADPLPKLPALGWVDSSTLGPLADHLGRHRGFGPAFVRLTGGPGGAIVMATVLSQQP